MKSSVRQSLPLRKTLQAMALSVVVVSCNGNGTTPTNGGGLPNNCFDDGCTTRDLPFTDSADAPTLTDVALECQSSDLVALATATDPQGTDNLLNVLQTIGVYPNEDCTGTLLTIQDDLVGSGVEETFGTVVDAADHPDLFDQICGCNRWPVEVLFSDADGNTTRGRVAARVFRTSR